MKKIILIILVGIVSIITLKINYNYKEYVELNSELNKLGYNQYNELGYLISDRKVKEMENLLTEALPPKGTAFTAYDGKNLFPIIYELLGANLEKNYRNKNLTTENKWYIMLQDYKNLTSLIKGKCDNFGDYTYSEEKNYYRGLICYDGDYKFSFTSQLEVPDYLEYSPTTDYINTHFIESSINYKNVNDIKAVSTTFIDGKVFHYTPDDENLTPEEIDELINAFIRFTDEMYEKYLNVIGK